MDIIAAHRLARKHNISATAVATIVILKEKGRLPIGTVAHILGNTGSALTSTADLLAKRGLAERQQSPTDRRVQFLQLTQAGENVIPA